MQPQRRRTKYSQAVQDIIAQLGHATNAQIATKLRDDFDDVSDTTVHRVTKRLLADSIVGLAPSANDGAHRFDANTHPHDHFECGHCDKLRDITIGNDIRQILSAELDGCILSGRLLITGDCRSCINKGGE